MIISVPAPVVSSSIGANPSIIHVQVAQPDAADRERTSLDLDDGCGSGLPMVVEAPARVFLRVLQHSPYRQRLVHNPFAYDDLVVTVHNVVAPAESSDPTPSAIPVENKETWFLDSTCAIAGPSLHALSEVNCAPEDVMLWRR